MNGLEQELCAHRKLLLLKRQLKHIIKTKVFEANLKFMATEENDSTEQMNLNNLDEKKKKQMQ